MNRTLGFVYGALMGLSGLAWYVRYQLRRKSPGRPLMAQLTMFEDGEQWLPPA